MASLTGLLLLAWGECAWALNPALDVSQYAHTAWKMRDGFVKGPISAIAQTPDGYLWLGTEYGLLRFDGVRAVPWQPPPNQSLPSTYIGGLLASRDGTLWIGTQKGLASWKDGKLTRYPDAGEQSVYRIVEDQEGTIWIGEVALPSPGMLCAIRRGAVNCYGDDGRFGPGVFGLFEDSKGSLWVGVRDGIWRWKPGPPKFFSLPGEANGIQCLGEDAEGTLLVGWKGGLYEVGEGETKPYSLAGTVPKFAGISLVRDRDGSIWIATNRQGVVRIRQRRVDTFSQSDGLSDDFAAAILEDREGNIWAGTTAGLDRFRDFAVATLSVKQGLLSSTVASVLADRDGSVWIGTYRGLNRWKNGQVTIAENGSGKNDGKIKGRNPLSLFQDNRGRVWISTIDEFGSLESNRFVSERSVPGGEISAISGDALGNLWVSNTQKGLFRLSAQGEVNRVSWAEFGHEDGALSLAIDPLRGGLWLGFIRGGVVYFNDGQIKASYGVTDGLGQGEVSRFRFDSDGTVWVGTGGGLSRLKNGRVATLTSKNGLPCDFVRWVIQDNDHSFWLSMPCGLVRILRRDIDAWAAAIDKSGDATKAVQVTVFDNSDGVQVFRDTGGYSPRVGRSPDGKLWFPATDGVSVIDPSHLPFNKLPPPMRIEQVIADRKTYEAPVGTSGSLPLPALNHDLQIDYTALSLVVPEKVLFQYKLEGFDNDWQDAGNRRQAFYTNLPPKKYTFRVKACNNSGVWNEAGTFLDFSVAPAYYQTRWFQVLCVLGAILVGWELYRLRVRRIVRGISDRFDERLAERARVARELHDTLLQTVMGSKYVVDGVLLDPSNDPPPRIRKALEKLSGSLDLATREARNAVNSLRASTVQKNDLAEALREAIEDCRRDPSMEASLYLSGDAKDMHPVVREEVYRIGFEAVRNACTHSQTERLEVSLSYGRDLTLCVSDIGIGIDPVIAEKGREGHLGLHSMRERAARIGGKLTMVSSVGSGTKITLVVPGSHIFRKPGVSPLEKLREIIKGPDRPFNSN